MKPVETSLTDYCIYSPCFSIAATAELIRIFSSREFESGCLLGCKKAGFLIDRAAEVPYGSRARDRFTVDSIGTDKLLSDWENSGIQLCGFIHSHLNGCPEFSPEDIEFANMLINSKSLKELWFGLAVEQDGHLVVLLNVVCPGENGLEYSPVGKLTLKKTE